MDQVKESEPGKARVARHRSRASAKGCKRVEVTVPSRDASLVRAIAGALREGGNNAKRIRDSMGPLVFAPKAQTGEELVAFFRASPLVDSAFMAERDESTGRSVDFE